METQILKLEAPFDYIYCNGEVGKHIATYIVGESRIDEDGKYTLETHSHPIVQYKDSPKGVVWNRAELTDCEVLCSEDDMRVDVEKFYLLCVQRADQKAKEAGCSEYSFEAWENSPDEAEPLKEKLRSYGIGFKSKEPVVEVGVEVGGCSDGYFAQFMEISIMYFHHIEPTLEELGKRLTEERAAIETTDIKNPANPLYGTACGPDTQDRVFILSNDEVFASPLASDYGFYAGSGIDDSARRFRSTLYAKCRGAWWSSVEGYRGNSFWFMRTSGYTSSSITYVCDFGYLYNQGTAVTCDDAAVLSAITVDLQKAPYQNAPSVQSTDVNN